MLKRVLFICCFICGFLCVESMDSNPLEFIQFLSKRHYLDGSRSVTSKDSEYVAQCISNFKIDGIFSNTTLHSFADNIAFIAAQTKQIELATQILLRSYEEDQNDDNWLFEELKQANREVTPDTIKESLVSTYKCND